MALGVAAASGCGKKGPPLAPLIPIPAAVEKIEARRVGDDVYVTFVVPAANIDQAVPGDVARVEVYGYTGRTAPARGRFVELGTLVATVPVAPAIAPPREGEAGATDDAPGDADATPSGAKQGARVTVRDALTADEMVQGRIAVERLAPIAPPTLPEAVSAVAPPLRRFYLAIPFNLRGTPGPPGTQAEVPLHEVPGAPADVALAYGEDQVTVNWLPSGGIVGFLLERPLPDELPPFGIDAAAASAPAGAAGATLYNVYRSLEPLSGEAVRAAADEPWQAAPDAPINPQPIRAHSFVDETMAFNRQRCYTVRAVRGLGPNAVVGRASPPACVTPIDTFPPAPPRSLAAVASEGAISLIWEPGTDPDLAGYVVLRGEAPGDTLSPLTPTPIAEARYRDASAAPGTRYVYAVVAVDNRLPIGNVSAESNRIEETAR